MIILLELILFFISSTIGTLGHFLYKFTDENFIIGFLFSKNESTFEHLKLGITPIIFLSIVEKIKLVNNNILAIKGIQILVFSLLIIMFYYIRKLFIKKECHLYNILIFYISLFTSYTVSFILLNIIELNITIRIIGILLFCLTLLTYIYNEIFTPNYLIFKDPLNQAKD